jgi:hypothetical protein
VPEPFAELLLHLVANRDYPSSASTTSRWLFPGRVADQPLAYTTMLKRLRRLGFPMREARVSALRQLVLQAAAPVVAAALGYHHTTTTRQVANVGATWSSYTAAAHASDDPQNPSIPRRSACSFTASLSPSTSSTA